MERRCSTFYLKRFARRPSRRCRCRSTCTRAGPSSGWRRNRPLPGPRWTRNFQKRWAELTVESLNKHRESLDSIYRSGIQLIEQTFRVSEAKTSDDYRRVVEDLWRKLLDVYKEQSESQVRDFQNWAAKSIEIQRASA